MSETGRPVTGVSTVVQWIIIKTMQESTITFSSRRDFHELIFYINCSCIKFSAVARESPIIYRGKKLNDDKKGKIIV
jgi:hypothetical protein